MATQAFDGGATNKGSLLKELALLRDKSKKITADYNQQSHDLNNALAENALLRQMSKVPDNFGEEVANYKINQQQNAMYYKRKNEAMEKEMCELNEQIVHLKAQLRRYAGFYANMDNLAQGLTQEQQRFLEDVIINLRDGKMEIPLTDKSKELQAKVDNQAFIIQTYDAIVGDHGENGKKNGRQIDQEQFDTLLKAIQEQRKDMENIFASMKNQPVSINGTLERPHSINDSRQEHQMGQTQQRPQTGDLNNTNFNQTMNNINRPPRPITGIFGDWTDVNEGMSYKFNTKLNIKSYDDELSGMDIDKAKHFIAVLQLHNLETMELLNQRENEHKLLTAELEEIRTALRKSLLVEDELFSRHHAEIMKVSKDTQDLRKDNETLKIEILALRENLGTFEKTITAIQSKNPTTIEGRLAEITKSSAISETNLIRLSRKYDALETEFISKEKDWKIGDDQNSEKIKEVIEKMNKLLEWRADATEKIKILMQRIKNSVPIEEHNTLKLQFDIERQKYASLKANENVLIQQNAEMRSLEREKAEEIEKIGKLEEDIAGLEAEFGVLHTRLSAMDPVYNRHAQVFKRIAEVMKNNNISPLQFFQAMDTDKSGSLSSVEFFKAMEQMGIVMTKDEAEQFFNFMDLDGSKNIDYSEFNRKLRRLGVVVRSKEEELVSKLWNAIVRSGLTLEKAYEAFDKRGQNDLNFNDFNAAIKELGLDVDARTSSEFFKLADVTGNGGISCAEFVHIFKRYNKTAQTGYMAADSTLDWKIEILARLDKICKEKAISLENVFNDIDGDGDKRVTLTEFSRLFLKMGIRIEKQEFNNLFNYIDVNRSGSITYPEFLDSINKAKRETEKLNRMKMFNQRMQSNSLLSESMIVDGDVAGGYNDPNTRYQLKLAHIEAKEKSAKRQAEEFLLKITRLEEEQARNQSNMKNFEDNLLKLNQQLIKEKEKSNRLEKVCLNSLSKEKSKSLTAENENLRIENVQLRSALDTFRSLHDAAVREAKTLKVAVGKNDDENLHLKREIRDMQAESDEKALIGKLFNQVLTEKWTEAAFNKKYDQALNDLKDAQIAASNLEAKLRKKEIEMFEMENGAIEKCALLEKQLFEARMSILPMISLSKLEEVNLALKRMSNQKLELEIENKRLRTEGFDNQVRLDNYKLRESNLLELEQILKDRYPDELSAKIIELSEKLRTYKLGELKAQREVSLIKEREEYYMRVNKNQTNQIQDLEEQVASNESKFNERENFWRARYNDQIKLLAKNSKETLITPSPSDQDLKNMLKIGLDKIASEDEKQMGYSPTRKSAIDPMANSTLEANNNNLLDKIKVLEQEANYKNLQIDQLKKKLETKEVGVNYRTDGIETLVINDLEAKTRDIAQAAQQTVITLQEMLEDKSKQIVDRDKKIDDLRNEIAEKSRTLAKLELEVESLRRENAVGEHNRMNVEQYAALRTIQKISSMDQKELEKVIATYENKLKLLAEELTEAERVNRELLHNLRSVKGEAAQLQNTRTFEANMSELAKIKNSNATMNEAYKKKCLEVKRLTEVLNKYTLDLEKKESEINKIKGEESAKVQSVKNEGGHYEERIAVLTNKFTTLNEQLKEDKRQIQELKTSEIRYREKIAELNQTNDKLVAMNNKLKDDNQKLMARQLAAPSDNQIGSSQGTKPAAIRRPSSASKQQGLPNIGTSTATKGTPGAQNSLHNEEIRVLREDLRKLTDENNEMRLKIATSPSAKNYLDEDGCLAPKGSMAFMSKEHLCESLRNYLNYLGPSTNLFSIMKRGDPKRTGKVPLDSLLTELSKAGINFTNADKAMLPEYLPRDPATGQVDYKQFYYMVKGNIKDFSGANTTGTVGSPTGGLFSAGGVQPKIASQAKKEKDDSNNLHSAVLDRNVDLLKRKVLEKDKEIEDLSKQLKTWKQTALNFENELKEKNNTGRNAGYGLNSTLEAKLGRKGESLKQIQDLEEQVKIVKKEMKYEVDRREQSIKELTDDLTRKNYEMTLAMSEAANLRTQLEKVLNGKIQKDQVMEEKEKIKDLQVASMMEKLDRSRKAEEDLRNKLRVIERENIDLKHIKEGIDARLESMNREIRELKDRRKND